MKNKIIKNIDQIIKNVNQFTVEPEFSNAKSIRENKVVPSQIEDNTLMKTFIELISFSQNANSKIVETVVKSGNLKKVFADFEIDEIAKMNPCDIVDEKWDSIKGIRQQAKIFHIVNLARRYKDIKNINKEILNSKIPKSISSDKDISEFWIGFKELKQVFKSNQIPFFRSTISLLHLLLELGYDCVKPDLVVMKVSKNLGIVNKETGEKNFVKTVKFIQEYSLKKNIRPGVVDLYFLIHGKQKGAIKYVQEEYYKK